MRAKGNGPTQDPLLIGSGKAADATLIQPFNADLWPLLADKAQNYTAYSIMSMRFIYQASKGSAYNGQITCGFTKETSMDSGLFSDPDFVVNLPVSMRFQASDTQNSMVVPANMMSQGGRSLFNPTDQQVALQEPTRYYAGTFMYCCEGCTDDSDIGRWHVEYDVRLEQSQMNKSSSSAEFALDHDKISVVKSGMFVNRPPMDNTVRVASIRNSLLLCMPACDCTVNGIEQIPVYVGTDMNLYSFPKLACADLGLSCSNSLAMALLFSAATPASFPSVLSTGASTTTTKMVKK